MWNRYAIIFKTEYVLLEFRDAPLTKLKLESVYSVEEFSADIQVYGKRERKEDACFTQVT